MLKVRLDKCLRRYSTCIRKPLKGVKVLDLTRIIAGPMCNQILADLGADVYKIEIPGKGDDARNWVPRYDKLPWSCLTFVALNRNKKSVCVNFASEDGRRIVREMATKCDVLVENYVPGTMAKYGLDYDSLRQIAPGLIYCSITGFGPDGPYAKRSGLDVIALSMSGVLNMTGPEGGEPCRVPTASVDIMTGLYAHGAIIAALYERQRTAKGCKIDSNLLATAISSLEHIGVGFLNTGLDPGRRGTENVYMAPYKTFETADGYLTVCASSDEQFVELCNLMNVPELTEDDRFITYIPRSKQQKELYRILGPVFKTKMTEEWCKVFENTRLLYAPVYNLEQVFEDPQVKHFEIVRELEFEDGVNVKTLDYPVKISDFKTDMNCPPKLGQHTDDVLRDLLNCSDETIANLRKSGAIS